MTSAATELQLRLIARDEASKILGDVESKASGFGKTLQNVGTIAGGFLAANVVATGIQKFTGFLGESIQAASDLEQAIGGTEAVFKENAGTIEAWAKDAAENFGLSKTQFREASTSIGGQLKRMTGDLDFATEHSAELVAVAADLAATYGGSTAEAVAALGSAFRGEADPAERFNLNLKVSAVNAKAVAMGLAESEDAVDDNARAQATLALIMEQSADAQGQFAREADSAAGSAQIEAAKMENLQAQLGEKLLPVQMAVTKAKIALADAIATKVIPLLEELYAKYWPSVQKAIQDVAATVEEWWPKLQPIFAFLFDFFKTRVEGFIQQVQGIIQVIQGVVDFVTAIVHGDWSAAWQALQDIAGGIIDVLIGNIKAQFGNIPGIILGLAGEAANSAGQFAQRIFDAIVRILERLPGKMAELGRNAANSFLNSISIAGVSAGDVAGFVGGLSPFAEGTPFVPRDMPAFIHKGEAVIPAAMNPFNPANQGRGLGGINMQVSIAAVYARDEAEARRSAGNLSWALATGLQARGVGRW